MTLWCLTVGVSAQTMQCIWGKSYGNPFQSEGPSGMAIDNSGNTYLTGFFYGSSVKFDSFTVSKIGNNGGSPTSFFAKLDESGKVQWANGPLGVSTSWGVAVDQSGNSFFCGRYSDSIHFDGIRLIDTSAKSPVYVAKYDANGNAKWVIQLSGMADCNAIATDTEGNIFIAGSFSNYPLSYESVVLQNLPYSDVNVFLLKLSPQGHLIWARSPVVSTWKDRSNANEAWGLGTDADGSVFISGYYNGERISFGSHSLSNQGKGNNLFVVKYDKNGNVLWANQANGLFQSRMKLSVSNAGDAFVTGYYVGRNVTFGNNYLLNSDTSGGWPDIFLARYNANGSLVFANSYGGQGIDESNGICLEPTGNCWISGTFRSSTLRFGDYQLANYGGERAFLSRFDSNGNALWADVLKGNATDGAYNVAINLSGQVMVSGWFSSRPLRIGNVWLNNSDTTAGTSDMFVAMLDRSTGVEESLQKESAFSVFPNPTTGKFAVKANLAQGDYLLFDGSGRTIDKGRLEFVNGIADVNVELSEGVYFLTVLDSDNTLSVKLVVTK